MPPYQEKFQHPPDHTRCMRESSRNDSKGKRAPQAEERALTTHSSLESLPQMTGSAYNFDHLRAPLGAKKEGKEAQVSYAPLTHSPQWNGSHPKHIQLSTSKTKPWLSPNQIPFQTPQFLSAVITQSSCWKPSKPYQMLFSLCSQSANIFCSSSIWSILQNVFCVQLVSDFVRS